MASQAEPDTSWVTLRVSGGGDVPRWMLAARQNSAEDESLLEGFPVHICLERKSGLVRLSCGTANFISAGVSAAGEPSSSGRM